MSLSHIIISYLEMNLLLVPAAFASFAFVWLMRRKNGVISAATGLKLNFFLMACLFILPMLNDWLPGLTPSNGPAQIWFAPSMHEEAAVLGEAGMTTISLSQSGPARKFEDETVSHVAGYLSLLTFICLALAVAADLRKIKRLTDGAWLVRRIGSVRVLVSDEVETPFSFWVPGRAYAVLPEHLTGNPAAWELALRHELQHHRQGDTRWVYLSQTLKFMFFWNPCAYLWSRFFNETREYACDEALIGRKTVSPQAYGRCLLEVAAATLTTRNLPVGATWMALSSSGTYLRRRIDMIFGTRKGRKGAALVVGMAALLLMTATVWAANGMVRDRRVDQDWAQELADNASRDSEMDIVVNSAVVEQLNRYLGTPDGQAFVKASLGRLENYREALIQKFDEYNTPHELLALPILESGFQNLPANERAPHAAGIWQFIPGTAQKYNLKVDGEIDQRLNPELATDAALRYLSALNLRFQDWSLAVLAYNAGEGRIQAGIRETGGRDAWELVERGFDGDPNYLSKLMALIIIMKNPQVLD